MKTKQQSYRLTEVILQKIDEIKVAVGLRSGAEVVAHSINITHSKMNPDYLYKKQLNKPQTIAQKKEAKQEALAQLALVHIADLCWPLDPINNKMVIENSYRLSEDKQSVITNCFGKAELINFALFDSETMADKKAQAFPQGQEAERIIKKLLAKQ